MRNVAKAVTLAIFVLFLAALLLILAFARPTPSVSAEKGSVKDAILLDAAYRFPNADKIDIVQLEKKGNDEVFVVRVTYNYSSVCPKRYHVYYTYPDGRFMPEYPVKVVTDCNMCKDVKEGCFITYEEEAIIASVNLNGTEAVRSFVLSEKPTAYVLKKGNVWRVLWLKDGRGYDVTLSDHGQLLNISRVEGVEVGTEAGPSNNSSGQVAPT